MNSRAVAISLKCFGLLDVVLGYLYLGHASLLS